MNRRNFIKVALLTTTTLASGKALAGEYGSKSIKGLNRLTKKENPTVGEKKHVPGIESPDKVSQGNWFNVKVNVGFMMEHPSTSGHWITMIKLLVDGKEIVKTNFNVGGVSEPAATFRIRLDKTSSIEAIENCNLHGTWVSNPVEIKVI
jgi:superoxide reductase